MPTNHLSHHPRHILPLRKGLARAIPLFGPLRLLLTAAALAAAGLVLPGTSVAAAPSARAQVAGVAVAPVTVTVNLKYFDIPEDRRRAVADVEVEIWTFAPRGLLWSWAVEKKGRTSASGRFSTTLPFRHKGVLYAVRFHTSNRGARCCSGFVLPGQFGDVIRLGTEVQGGSSIEKRASGPGDTVSFNRVFRDGFAAVYNALDAMGRAAAFVRRYEVDTADDRIGRAVIGADHLRSGSWFDPVVGHVNLIPRDRWNDWNVLHEYGHHVEHQIGSLAWIASDHSGCTPGEMAVFGQPIFDWWKSGKDAPYQVRAQHAWLEGFADWFAEVVYADSPASFRARGWSGYLEGARCTDAGPWPDGDRFEDHVAAFLWDMTDPFSSAEPDDLDGGPDQIGAIIRAVDTQLDGHRWPIIGDLTWLYFAASGPTVTSSSSMENALRNKVSYVVLN